MNYQAFNPQQYTIGLSNGTTTFPRFALNPTDNMIVVESIGMFGVEVFLRDAPSQTRPYKSQVRPEVAASLEHSLKEHAATWAELAKH